MPVSGLAHFLIATEDMAATRDWYCAVLGLTEGPHPDFNFPVCWLYAEGRDVVHIAQSASAAGDNQKAYLGRVGERAAATGALDHVAFHASGLDASLERLKRHGVEYFERRADDQALYQVFCYDPNGIKVELNFPATEAAGRVPEVVAVRLPRAGR